MNTPICAVCGYDLRATPTDERGHDSCPECGKVFDAHSRPRLSWVEIVLMFAVVLLLPWAWMVGAVALTLQFDTPHGSGADLYKFVLVMVGTAGVLGGITSWWIAHRRHRRGADAMALFMTLWIPQIRLTLVYAVIGLFVAFYLYSLGGTC